MNLFRVACLYWNTLQLCLISRNCSVFSSVVFLCLPIHGIVSESVVPLCSFGEFFFFFSLLGPKNTRVIALFVGMSLFLLQWENTSRQKVEQLSFFLLYVILFYAACFHCLKIIVSHFFQFTIFLWQENKSSPSSGLVARNRDPPPNHPSNSFKSTWVIMRALAIH